ncbi:MAG: hypothetical protein QM762_04365 [Chryseolinea sp.]
MRYSPAPLFLLILLLSCQEKMESSLSTYSIHDRIKGLKKTEQTEFGGGDVWGMRYVFNNADSSAIKVVVDFTAGEYGNGTSEYWVIDEQLVVEEQLSPGN